MDANGLRFWQLADAVHWHGWAAGEGLPSGVEYDDARRVLRLARQRPAPQLVEDASQASSAAEMPAATRDACGSRAWWDAAQEKLYASGARAGVAELPLPPATRPPSDLAAGHDGVLYVARAGVVQLLDLRGRWPATEVAHDDFTAHRLAADPRGGVWVLDRGRGQIARLHGLPLPARPYQPYKAGTFRPCVDNRDPPRLDVYANAVLPASEHAVAVACNTSGRVVVLSWHDTEDARLRELGGDGAFGPPQLLKGLRRPYSLTWLNELQIAVRATGAAEAWAYAWPDAAPTTTQTLLPAGDYYPLVDAALAPFVQGTDLPPHYVRAASDSGETRPLLRLSLPGYARRGIAANFANGDALAVPTLLDSGTPACEWHRVYLEASLHAGTGARLWLAASETPRAPVDDDDWHLHLFGDARQDGDAATAPRAAWLAEPSELPFHPGLLSCPREAQRSGLFTVLIQRAGRAVRALRGRYLWVRLELLGNGRRSPEIAALRAYGARFSYRDRYLPELYRETVFEPDASVSASATPADFLERLLGNFESVLTPLEDRIANSYLLTDTQATPDEALEWLAAWIGLAFDSGYPPSQRRVLLEAAPYLYRLHGTAGGLRAALEIATGGQLRRAPLTQRGDSLPQPGEITLVAAGDISIKALVLATRGTAGAGEIIFVAGGALTGGELIVVENFRMRRVLATILGAELADVDDPLLAALVQSGNSFVGDTLFLGDESRKAFLALFGDGLAKKPQEEAAVAALYDDLAYRVTVLVHDAADAQTGDAATSGVDLALVRRVARAAAPAHVLLAVQPARYAFLCGIASLVAVDSYLGDTPMAQPVRIASSYLGIRDLLIGPATLDPRFESAGIAALPSAPPTAVLAGPASAEAGASFVLDGSASQAAPQRQIERYIWTWNETGPA